MKRERILIVEAPDDDATVDFLHHNASANLRVINGQLEITVKVFEHGDDSMWRLHEFTVPLP